jgi:CheY-like chemotaxis protein
MDVRMPELDGIEATRQLLGDEGATAKVVMLTTFDMDEYVYEALRAGASGFLLKDVPPEQLIAGIRAVASGDALLAPSVTRRVIEEFVRARGAEADRPRAFERGDRQGALRQRDDRQDSRRARTDEAPAARSGAGRRARLRIRPRPAGRLVVLLEEETPPSKIGRGAEAESPAQPTNFEPCRASIRGVDPDNQGGKK